MATSNIRNGHVAEHQKMNDRSRAPVLCAMSMAHDRFPSRPSDKPADEIEHNEQRGILHCGADRCGVAPGGEAGHGPSILDTWPGS
jgi:hypothetical protein